MKFINKLVSRLDVKYTEEYRKNFSGVFYNIRHKNTHTLFNSENTNGIYTYKLGT